MATGKLTSAPLTAPSLPLPTLKTESTFLECPSNHPKSKTNDPTMMILINNDDSYKLTMTCTALHLPSRGQTLTTHASGSAPTAEPWGQQHGRGRPRPRRWTPRRPEAELDRRLEGERGRRGRRGPRKTGGVQDVKTDGEQAATAVRSGRARDSAGDGPAGRGEPCVLRGPGPEDEQVRLPDLGDGAGEGAGASPGPSGRRLREPRPPPPPTLCSGRNVAGVTDRRRSDRPYSTVPAHIEQIRKPDRSGSRSGLLRWN